LLDVHLVVPGNADRGPESTGCCLQVLPDLLERERRVLEVEPDPVEAEQGAKFRDLRAPESDDGADEQVAPTDTLPKIGHGGSFAT
jgi:hypothetical protein